MTKKGIIDKLRRALSEDITRESDLVYVLVECRKLLEGSKQSDPHFALKFYCHWAMHVDLSGRDTTLPFLARVESFTKAALADEGFGEQHRMFRELAFMNSFRELFRDFLQSYGLPTQVCDEDRRWHTFLGIYASVIDDGSIACNAPPGYLQLIKRVTFSKGRPIADCYLPFDMVWDIHLEDGRTLTINVHAPVRPPGQEMLFHGFHLH